MSITQVFFRIWKAVTLPIIVASVLVCYFSLPDSVAVHHDAAGKPDVFFNKQTLFYWAVGTVIFINLLMSFFGKSFTKLLPQLLPKNLLWSETPRQTTHLTDGWANGLTALLNTFFLLCLLALNKVNGNENQVSTTDFTWIIIVAAAIFMAILFYLPYNLLYSKPTEEG